MKSFVLFCFMIVYLILPAQDRKVAEQFFLAGNFNSALSEYEILINEYPKNVEYNFNLAVCYLNTNGDKSRAISYLEFLVKNPKIIPDTWYLLGRAYHFGYHFDDAIKAYQKFIDINKGNIENLDNAPKQIEYCDNAKELMKFPVDVTFENLGKNVNSTYADYFPFIPVNESFLLYNSKQKDKSTELENGMYASNIYLSEVKDGKFQKSRLLTDKINSVEFSEEVVGLNASGNKAIIYIDNHSEGGDLYDCSINDISFSSLHKLDDNINSKDAEIAACITDDESKLFFASDRDGGYGGVDIYLCQKLPNGKWSFPQNLGPTINSEFDEDFPNISPDGKTLYFSSKGHTSMGGYDIFSSKWDDVKKKFSGVKNLGYPINTPEDNMNFRISKSGRYGYISAIRKGGFGDLDIYRVQFNSIESRYTVITGKIKTQNGNDNIQEVYIQVTDQETDEIYGDYAPNETSMRYVIILPPGKYNMYVIGLDCDELYEEIEIFDKASFRTIINKEIVLEKHSRKE